MCLTLKLPYSVGAKHTIPNECWFKYLHYSKRIVRALQQVEKVPLLPSRKKKMLLRGAICVRVHAFVCVLQQRGTPGYAGALCTH